MKIKTSRLTGAALDWAVAKCEGHAYVAESGVDGIGIQYEATRYSTDWAQGGPIIEREAVNWYRNNKRGFPNDEMRWEAHITVNHDEAPNLRVQYRGRGATQLIAAMRCYVTSKLGDDIDIPEELL